MAKRQFVNTDANDLLKIKCAKRTVYQQNSAYNSFLAFMRYKDLNVDVKELSFKDLDEMLRDFYISLRKGEELYKRNTYLSLRQSLRRKLEDVMDRKVDIIKDENNFPLSIEIFQCLLKKVKADGRGETEHYDEINEKDFSLISSRLDINVPQQLQWLVFVVIGLFFARRGNENLDGMTKDDFGFKLTENGKRYIHLKKDELTKNHRQNDPEKSNGGLIVETNLLNCPYSIVLHYIKKLNPLNRYFWQRPRDSFCIDDETWFEIRKIGVNTIKDYMSNISKFCNLSKTYTNHCLGVSCCSILGTKHAENDIKKRKWTC